MCFVVFHSSPNALVCVGSIILFLILSVFFTNSYVVCVVILLSVLKCVCPSPFGHFIYFACISVLHCSICPTQISYDVVASCSIGVMVHFGKIIRVWDKCFCYEPVNTVRFVVYFYKKITLMVAARSPMGLSGPIRRDHYVPIGAD